MDAASTSLGELHATGLTFCCDVAAKITSMRSFAAGADALQPNTRIIDGPGRQPIDLRPDHAVEEIGCLGRKIELMRHDMSRTHLRLDAASAKRGLPIRRQRRLRPAAVEAKRQVGERALVFRPRRRWP